MSDRFHPHSSTLRVWLLTLSVCWMLFTLVPSVALAVFGAFIPARWVAGLLTLITLTVAIYMPYGLASISYSVANQGVIIAGGVFWRNEKAIKYRRITSVTVSQGPMERFFGLHHLSIQTAGQGSSAVAEGKMMGLQHPEHIKRLIEENIAISSPAQRGQEESSPSMEGYLREILSELRDIKERL